MIDHVFKGLLQGEKEAANGENLERTALSAKNYKFTMTGMDTSERGPAYVSNVVPRHDNKFLYRGKIWVDANDFAVTRIEAEPAKSPSFWVKKSEINQDTKRSRILASGREYKDRQFHTPRGSRASID